MSDDPRLATMDALLSMVRKHGLSAESVSVGSESISVGGLIPLPPTPEEESYEASQLKLDRERRAEQKRMLNIE